MRQSAMRRLGVSALLSGGLGAAARWRGALTTSGAVGAVVTGASITGAGGWDWGTALVYFFLSSTALSQVATARKVAIAADKFDKGSQRDLAQALANGGVAAALALLRATPLGERHASLLEGAFVGALATANADTWATEVGTLSRQVPRLVTTGRRVAPGTSGGITPLGMAAAAAGAATLGLVFGGMRAVVSRGIMAPAVRGTGAPRLVGAALIGGLTGCMVDSLLGAMGQAMYRCPRCGVETERRTHTCGSPTVLRRGLSWLDNDGVNAVSTLVGGLAGAVAVMWRAGVDTDATRLGQT